MNASNRHPAQVTSDRLLTARETWHSRLSDEDQAVILAAHHVLARIAEEETAPRGQRRGWRPPDARARDSLVTLKPCTNCEASPPRDAHRIGWRAGYCRRCYSRWMDHGFPAGGPPAERVQLVGSSSHGRVEDYAELRSWGRTRREAAARLGVTIRSALRYEARLRDAGDAGWPGQREERAA